MTPAEARENLREMFDLAHLGRVVEADERFNRLDKFLCALVADPCHQDPAEDELVRINRNLPLLAAVALEKAREAAGAGDAEICGYLLESTGEAMRLLVRARLLLSEAASAAAPVADHVSRHIGGALAGAIDPQTTNKKDQEP